MLEAMIVKAGRRVDVRDTLRALSWLIISVASLGIVSLTLRFARSGDPIDLLTGFGIGGLFIVQAVLTLMHISRAGE